MSEPLWYECADCKRQQSRHEKFPQCAYCVSGRIWPVENAPIEAWRGTMPELAGCESSALPVGHEEPNELTALRAEVTRLRAEVSRLTADAGVSADRIRELEAQVVVSDGTSRDWHAEAVRLLKKYGEHRVYCEKGMSPTRECTCGLDDILAARAATTEST